MSTKSMMDVNEIVNELGVSKAFAYNLIKKFNNELDQKIYDLCTRTLKLCMMDRYVDTPWREQGFYVYRNERGKDTNDCF